MFVVDNTDRAKVNTFLPVSALDVFDTVADTGLCNAHNT